MKTLNKISVLFVLPVALLIFNQSCSDSQEAGLGDTNTQFEQGNIVNTTGISGSLNQFIVAGTNNNYLYAVDNSTITVFDISNENTPVKVNEITTENVIETVYPLGDHLLLGSPNGMFIYNISQPQSPEYIAFYEHSRSCDPVVAEGNFAYVTLRTGGNCGGIEDELHILDISDMANPVMVYSQEMENPYGLGIDGNRLFVCDGEAGLKVYEVNDPRQGVKLIAQFKDVVAKDVIPLDGILILMADEGIYQYKYTDEDKKIELMSSIKVVK